MSNAAIYARVSSARQKEQDTIGSQTAALRAHAEQAGLDVPEQWMFCDDGQSGASLVRPALERLRDLVCQVPVDVLVVYSPDRLARKYAYQALLIEEFARPGTAVVFVKGPRSDSPEDALLVQFQGMIAEYERAQIMERTRRGKTHRAKAGTVNVLSGAPFGYRYVRRSDHAEARYEIVPHEAAIVAELFGRYADGGVAIGELTRWLSGLGVATRTGKPRWDRSVLWAMLRNPAYAGRACFGKTMRTEATAGQNRTARIAGRSTPRCYTVAERPREEWLEIPVPALLDADTWERAQRRLADNKRYAARNSSDPSLLHGICACGSCGYAYYRTSTRTTNKKIYYYRCLGSDDYRYEHGRVCANKPVRADYLDTVVWDHISDLLADPALIRAEINKRLEQVRTADPATAQRQRLDAGLAKAATAISRLIGAFQEELIFLEELRSRMPELRSREAGLRHQIRPRRPTRRPGGLPQTRRRRRRLPHRTARQDPHRHRHRTPTRPATARQRRPHRPRQDHYPTLHPSPQHHPQPHPRPTRNRLRGRNAARLPTALEESCRPCWPTSRCPSSTITSPRPGRR